MISSQKNSLLNASSGRYLSCVKALDKTGLLLVGMVAINTTSAIKIKRAGFANSAPISKTTKSMNQYRDKRDRHYRNMQDPKFREFKRIEQRSKFFKQGMEVKAAKDFVLGFEDGSKQISKGQIVGVVYQVDGPEDRKNRRCIVDVQLSKDNYYSNTEGLIRHERINMEDLELNTDARGKVFKKNIERNIRKGEQVKFLSNVLSYPADQSKTRVIPQGTIGFVYELDEEINGRGNQGFQIACNLPPLRQQGEREQNENPMEQEQPEFLHYIHAYDRHNVGIQSFDRKTSSWVLKSTQSFDSQTVSNSIASQTQFLRNGPQKESIYQKIKKVKISVNLNFSENFITYNSPLKSNQEYHEEQWREQHNKEYKVLAIVKDVLAKKDQKDQYGLVKKGWSYDDKDTQLHLQIELPQYKKNERGILVPETCIIPYYQLHNVHPVQVEETEDSRQKVPLIEIQTYEGRNQDGSDEQNPQQWIAHEQNLSRKQELQQLRQQRNPLTEEQKQVQAYLYRRQQFNKKNHNKVTIRTSGFGKKKVIVDYNKKKKIMDLTLNEVKERMQLSEQTWQQSFDRKNSPKQKMSKTYEDQLWKKIQKRQKQLAI